MCAWLARPTFVPSFGLATDLSTEATAGVSATTPRREHCLTPPRLSWWAVVDAHYRRWLELSQPELPDKPTTRSGAAG